MKLFEVETILSVTARGADLDYITPLQEVEIDLSALSNRPFDTDGLQVSHDARLKTSVEDISATIEKYKKAF